MEISFKWSWYSLGNFYWVRFPYYPIFNFSCFILYFLHFPSLLSPSQLNPPVLASPSMYNYLIYFPFLIDLSLPCSPLIYLTPYLTSSSIDATGYHWFNIYTHKQIHNILKCLSRSGIPHSKLFFSRSIHLPMKNGWVTLHCDNILHFKSILLLRGIQVVSSF